MLTVDGYNVSCFNLSEIFLSLVFRFLNNKNCFGLCLAEIKLGLRLKPPVVNLASMEWCVSEVNFFQNRGPSSVLLVILNRDRLYQVSPYRRLLTYIMSNYFLMILN